jgi:hypothetical protein
MRQSSQPTLSHKKIDNKLIAQPIEFEKKKNHKFDRQTHKK